MKLKFLATLLTAAGCLLFDTSHAAVSVTVTINTNLASGYSIPRDFVGLSFGTKEVNADSKGGHFFAATNTPLVTLFKNMGLTRLRLGGTSVESPVTTAIPNTNDIANLFAFAKAAGVQKVIYTLRLLATNASLNYTGTNTLLANYIWSHYSDLLESFSIGNEPDLQSVFSQDYSIRGWPTYLPRWQQMASAIAAAVPGAPFSGPDGSGGNITWTTNFANTLKNTYNIYSLNEHIYVGNAGAGVVPADGIAAMLSKGWLQTNLDLYNKIMPSLNNWGMRFCFTEANDYYSGGAVDASDTFAGALWALDFLHWWTEHGAMSVHFHNTLWKVNDVITEDSKNNLMIYPKGYGVRAFCLGSAGITESSTISNPNGMNLTCYVVFSQGGHWVTLINKEYGASAPAADVTINVPINFTNSARTISMISATGDPAAINNITLGGDTIVATRTWNGTWTPLPATNPGQYKITVPPASAVIVNIPPPRNLIWRGGTLAPQ